MQWRSCVALGVAISLATGCASHGGSSVGPDPDVITVDQIVRSKATNAYDLIASVRPQMFTAHGAPTTRGQQPATKGRQAMPVVVYIDNVKVGPVAELKALATIDLREIRYLSPRVATDRWGENHAGGVIYVTTAQATGPDTAATTG
jgi:outer membrane cobalamin receptor